ncbi:SDR family oxidoreductase [bacterium]|nr:MAG: SDR family oxidoreductase [bacterium]
MKEVLITGSEGFVGHHLWNEMIDNGYEVFGTDLQVKTNASKFYSCDITKAEEIEKIFSSIRPEVIFHLAGWSNPGLSFTYPQKVFEINVIGTINLLESVRKINNYHPRIIIIGSSAELGTVPQDKLPITENTPLNPNSPYGVSKVASWFVCQQYISSYKMDIVYATPFNHTGPGQGLGFISSDIASQIAKIEKGEQEPIIKTGDLSTLREMLDVRDVVRAYRLLLEKGKSGERYLICTGKSTPIKEVVDTLLSLSTVKIKIETDPEKLRPSDMPEQRGNPEKLHQTTGWQPEIPLEITLKNLLDWYREKR